VMWTAFRSREVAEECPHDSITATANYGLQRTVCGDCGHVSVGYLHDIFEGQDLEIRMTSRQSPPAGATAVP
jgi:flavoprotein